jgi:hypothetical protein
MPGHVIAAVMVRETTRRHIAEPRRARPRHAHFATARALRAIANHREPTAARATHRPRPANGSAAGDL